MEREKKVLEDGSFENKKKKRKVRMIILSILLVLVLLLGSSYAFFTLSKTGEKQNIIKIGKLSLVLNEEAGSGIKLENAVPTPIDQGLKGTPYHFTIENNGTVDADYSVYLDNTGTIDDPYMFYYALKKDGKIIDMNYLNSFDVLSFGTIHPGKKVEYDLYIWLDYNVAASDVGTGYYQGTIRIESNQQKVRKLSSYVNHACDGETECQRNDEGMTYFQQHYYGKDAIRKYIWYSGKLWLATGYDNDGNVKAITTQVQTQIPWGSTSAYQGSYVESWLNEEFLPTLNNYQKFLVTDYPWNYSVLPAAGSNYQTPIGNETIVTSPVGLLNTWDIFQASDGDDRMTGADTILGSGLTGFHYYLGNANSEGKVAVSGGGLISYGPYELGSTVMPGISPAVVFNKDVKVVSGTGTQENPYRLEGDTGATSGALLNTRYGGEYVAFGDQLNYTYRINKVEGGKTKLNATYPLIVRSVTTEEEKYEHLVVYTTTSSSTIYNRILWSTSGGINYNPSSTDFPLAYFLNHDFLEASNGYMTASDRLMIAENQTWYMNSVSFTQSYKKAGASASGMDMKTTATVGLPILGERSFELETNPLVSGTVGGYRNILLTLSGGSARHFFNVRHTSGSTSSAVIPSLYLKSSVKIKSGSGTKNDPYILTT